MRKVHVAMMQV